MSAKVDDRILKRNKSLFIKHKAKKYGDQKMLKFDYDFIELLYRKNEVRETINQLFDQLYGEGMFDKLIKSNKITHKDESEYYITIKLNTKDFYSITSSSTIKESQTEKHTMRKFLDIFKN